MSSRLIKLASAVVLAAPLVFVFAPHSANAFDCDQKYGGASSRPTCNDVGVPLRVEDGKPYQVRGTDIGSGEVVALCDGARMDPSAPFGFSGQETADSAESVVKSGAALVAGLGDHAGRIVGYVVESSGTPSTVTVACRDDHAPFAH